MNIYEDEKKALTDAQRQVTTMQQQRVDAPATPPGVTASQFDERDDSVTNRLTGLMSSDNPLMRQAQTAGLQQANRRGLLNSSIAVGAAQAEAYRTALPIAQQEAAQAAQYNALSREIGSREKMMLSEQAAAKQRLGMELDSRETLALAEMAAAKQRLGIELTSREKLAADQIAAQKEMQGVQIGADMERLTTELGSREALAFAEQAAAKERLGMQLTSQERLAADQLAAQVAMQEAQIASQQLLASGQITANAQQTLVQSNTSAYNIYSSAVADIERNTTMDRDAKIKALGEARKRFDETIRRNQALYRSSLTPPP
jgi:hypothetical protein